MLNVSKPSSAGRRERSLNDQELRLFWLATGQIGYPFGAIWRLLALTALRKNEVAGVSFDEIDYEHDRWIIPGSRMKNKLNHLVPITTEMRNVFEGLPSPANERKLVFTKTGTRHVSGFSKAKDILDQMMLKVAQLEASHAGAKADQVEKISITPWVAHDLRRTFTSACGRMGIPLEHSEAVLSHRTFKSGLLGVYNVYEYEDEKRVTLEKWQAYIQRLVDEQPCAILDKIQTGRNA